VESRNFELKVEIDFYFIFDMNKGLLYDEKVVNLICKHNEENIKFIIKVFL